MNTSQEELQRKEFRDILFELASNQNLLFNGDNQMEKKHYYGDIKNLMERKENTYGKRNEYPRTVTPRLCTS